MRIQYPLMIVFVILFLYSCKKNSTTELDDTNTHDAGIVGKWQWIVTYSGGFNPHTTTPLEGELIVIQFASDNNYYSFSHDTLKHSTRYSIRKGVQIDTLSFEDMPNDKQLFWFPGQDTLMISNYPGPIGNGSMYIKY